MWMCAAAVSQTYYAYVCRNPGWESPDNVVRDVALLERTFHDMAPGRTSFQERDVRRYYSGQVAIAIAICQ